MNYYPFHIGDYASATRHLSWDEDAAYRRLLDVYYTHESPLPLEERKVFRLVMAATDAQREAVLTVLEEFFEKTEYGWVNRRADAEILAMKDKQQKQRDRVNKRWDKQRNQASCTGSSPGNTSDSTAVQVVDTTVSRIDTTVIPPTPTPTPTELSNDSSPPVDPPPQLPPPKPPKPSGSGTRLPRDWMLPPEWLSWACTDRGIAERQALDIADRFRDYWVSVPGGKGRKLDWAATWRNWVRNERVKHEKSTRTDNTAVGKVQAAIAARNACEPAGEGFPPDDFIDLGAADYHAITH